MSWRIGLTSLALLLCACGEAPAPVPDRPTPTAPVTAAGPTRTRIVTDMIGRAVAVGEAATRVVALSPAAADFATSLGLQVVGRSNDTPEASAPGSKPTGPAIAPDFNLIAALQPDLVIADAAFHSGKTRDFDQFAYPVFVLKANTYAEVLAAVTALGEAAHRVAEGAKARADLELRAGSAITAGRANLQRSSPPKVLILAGGGRDVFAGGSATYVGNLVEQLGGVNVLGSAPEGGPIAGFGVIEVSQAAAQNPDVVLILPSGAGGLAAQIRADPAWANTPAVRQGRVHELDIALFLRAPGPRVTEALEGLLPILWR